MQNSNTPYRMCLAQLAFALAAMTSSSFSLAERVPFQYKLLSIEVPCLEEMPEGPELELKCKSPAAATAPGQTCIQSGGEVVIERRAGKRVALCRTAVGKQPPPRSALKPPPGSDDSPGPYDQGSGSQTKTLPIKPPPISSSPSPAQSSSVYCRSGSPPPCPPTGTVGSDATQAKEKLRATTKTQGDFNLGARTSPPGLPPPIVSESKTIKPPYSPTNPAPMDSKDPK